MSMIQPGIRYSVGQLQSAYDNGETQPLEDLVRAWKGIQELPSHDPRSFFVLGGFHGEPFIYRTDVNYTYWGGWCNHGNILFPTWHRVYVFKLEKALQSIVPGVMMPYWDETSPETLAKGVPAVLTQQQFPLDGVMVKNPLYSFTLPQALTDELPGDDNLWAKPAGYETVRYPLSGLVGTPEAQAATDAHNAQYPNPVTNQQLLNDNVTAWLNGANPTPTDPNPTGRGVNFYFHACLLAPNYTAFSNTTSSAAWNKANSGLVVPLEQPHNDIHLAVGGFDAQGFETGQVAGANGDMGENNTAGLDPIFFFHHCNVDRVFWLWQERHSATNSLSVIAGYPGTNSSDSQGPTPGIAPNTPLDLTFPLNPFLKQSGSVYTSEDCINIIEMGYNYSHGSLDLGARPVGAESMAAEAKPAGLDAALSGPKLTVDGINRGLFKGSFIIRAYALVDGKEYFLGNHSVLSRWNVKNCANCLTHLEVVAHFPLDLVPNLDAASFRIEFKHREKELPVGLKYSVYVN